MLDHVGLLSAGNEELVRFVWKTFARWQQRSGGDKEKEKELFRFMKGFRETFARPVRRIRFLGLFDTVNSVSKVCSYPRCTWRVEALLIRLVRDSMDEKIS